MLPLMLETQLVLRRFFSILMQLCCLELWQLYFGLSVCPVSVRVCCSWRERWSNAKPHAYLREPGPSHLYLGSDMGAGRVQPLEIADRFTGRAWAAGELAKRAGGSFAGRPGRNPPPPPHTPGQHDIRARWAGRPEHHPRCHTTDMRVRVWPMRPGIVNNRGARDSDGQ